GDALQRVPCRGRPRLGPEAHDVGLHVLTRQELDRLHRVVGVQAPRAGEGGDLRAAVVQRRTEGALAGDGAGEVRQRRVAVRQTVGEEDDDLVPRVVGGQRRDRGEEGEAGRGGRPAAGAGGPGRIAAQD